MTRPKPPYWLSGGWTAYVLTLVALVAAPRLGAPNDAINNLSMALMLGLPVLIGGRQMVDHARAKASTPATITVTGEESQR